MVIGWMGGGRVYVATTTVCSVNAGAFVCCSIARRNKIKKKTIEILLFVVFFLFFIWRRHHRCSVSNCKFSAFFFVSSAFWRVVFICHPSPLFLWMNFSNFVAFSVWFLQLLLASVYHEIFLYRRCCCCCCFEFVFWFSFCICLFSKQMHFSHFSFYSYGPTDRSNDSNMAGAIVGSSSN